MPRYIDAETALKIIDNYAKTVTEDGKAAVDAIRDIIAVITPTADVAPKSEGEWVYGEYDIPHCSECGFEPAEISPYCPHCGAKMEGGE